jgi:hypothetical protein
MITTAKDMTIYALPGEAASGALPAPQDPEPCPKDEYCGVKKSSSFPRICRIGQRRSSDLFTDLCLARAYQSPSATRGPSTMMSTVYPESFDRESGRSISTAASVRASRQCPAGLNHVIKDEQSRRAEAIGIMSLREAPQKE